MKEQKSPAGYVSFSAFMHAAVLFGLAIIPAMKLLPEGGQGDSVEITTDGGGGSSLNELMNDVQSQIKQVVSKTETAPEPVQPTPPVVQQEPVKAVPVPQEPVKEVKQEVVKPAPIVAEKPVKPKPVESKPVAAKPVKSKAVAPVVEKTSSHQDEIAQVQNDAEKFAQQQKPEAVPEAAVAEAATEEEQVAQATAQMAAVEAVRKQQLEQKQEPLPAPATQPIVQKLNDIQEKSETSSGTGATSDSTASASGAGAGGGSGSGEEGSSRSYLDLKQTPGNKAPVYPIEARRKGQQGQVVLNYFVTTQGGVKDVRIEKSSGVPELDREAVRAAEKYRYVAGQEGWTTHPVVFTLTGQATPAPSRLRVSGQGTGRGQ